MTGQERTVSMDSCGFGRLDAQHQEGHGYGKNAIDQRLQPVFRDMVFRSLNPSRHDQSFFHGI